MSSGSSCLSCRKERKYGAQLFAQKGNLEKWIRPYISKTFRRYKYHNHIGEFHLNKSKESLKSRCIKERKNISTFVGDKSDVIDLVVETLLENTDAIVEYLADDLDNEDFCIYGDLPPYIRGILYGFKGHDWSQGAITCQEFVIVITKLKGENGFAIKSAYPVIPEV